MKNQKQKIVVGALTAFLTLGAISPAWAADPDSGAWVSNYWNTGRVLKEWLDWRASLGWGIIGTSNAILTAAGGSSKGQITRAALQAFCGTTAAGVLSTWTPKSEPTVASHIRATIKASAVVGSASLCGWVTQFAFNAVDSRIPAAQRDINNMDPDRKAILRDTMVDLNNNFLRFEQLMKDYADANSRSHDALFNMQRARCVLIPGVESGPCLQWINEEKAQRARADQLLKQMNNAGNRVREDIHGVDVMIGS